MLTGTRTSGRWQVVSAAWWLGLVLALTASLPVQAAETTLAAGPITAVTVLPSGAWVTRVLPITADAVSPGKPQTVRITGLPADLDRQSLRFGGAVDQQSPLRLTRRPADQRADVQALLKQIATQQQQHDKAKTALLAAGTRLAILKAQMSKLTGKAAGAFLSDENERARFDRQLSRLLDQRQQAQAELRQISQQQAELNKRLAALRKQGGGLTLHAVLAFGSDSKQPPTLSYRVRHAGWSPVYVARLDSGSRQVDWQMTAEVHQQSGEDWSHVRLVLATLDNRRYYPVPRLPRWTIGFRDDRVRPLAKSAVVQRKAHAGLQSDQGQWLNPGGLDARFQVGQAVSLASQAEPVRVTVSKARLPARMAVRVAPQRQPLAVLTAQVTLDTPTALPAGRLVLFRDGTEVGSHPQSALSPQQELVLGFGADRGVVVDYQPAADQSAEHGLIGKSRQLVRKAQVRVTNRHDRVMPVTVLMQLPVATDADIAVEPLPGNTTPATRRFDGTDGVWAWSRDLSPGKAMTVDFGFRVRWPEDKHLSGI